MTGNIRIVIDQLLDSWERQASMVASVAELLTEENRGLKANNATMTLDQQFCHIHKVRHGWLWAVSKEHEALLGSVYTNVNGQEQPIADLDEIRNQLAISAKAVRDAAEVGLKAGGKFGPYDNALLFIQHMVWHEGYHVGQIYSGLLSSGLEPDEMWEEKHIWELWRGPDEW